jgi:histidine phosphotransferase ChpT
MARGHIEDGKITITWNLPRLLLPKNRVKLLLEHADHCAADDPARRYADDRSDRRRRDDEFSRHLGRPERPPAAEHRRSPERNSTASVDAHAVQPYYTRLLAQACGLSVTLALDGEKVIVTAPERPRANRSAKRVYG